MRSLRWPSWTCATAWAVIRSSAPMVALVPPWRLMVLFYVGVDAAYVCPTRRATRSSRQIGRASHHPRLRGALLYGRRSCRPPSPAVPQVTRQLFVLSFTAVMWLVCAWIMAVTSGHGASSRRCRRGRSCSVSGLQRLDSGAVLAFRDETPAGWSWSSPTRTCCAGSSRRTYDGACSTSHRLTENTGWCRGRARRDPDALWCRPRRRRLAHWRLCQSSIRSSSQFRQRLPLPSAANAGNGNARRRPGPGAYSEQGCAAGRRRAARHAARSWTPSGPGLTPTPGARRTRPCLQARAQRVCVARQNVATRGGPRGRRVPGRGLARRFIQQPRRFR